MDSSYHTALAATRSSPEGGGRSLTYEAFYGLHEKAFSLSSDPRFWFRGRSHAPAFDDLLTGIRRREGLIALTGEIGTGKTTLCRAALQQLDARTFSAFVADPFVSREDLLKTLLVDFGVVSIADVTRGRLTGASRSDLSYLLYEFLDSLVPLEAFAVLVIDEAQHLSLSLLEEIRILSELERREKLLQVVLVGQPELRENLKLPQMRQVAHRISVRCELTPLHADEVPHYVQHRLYVAGFGTVRAEFTSAALEAVYKGSAGVPRLINRICDRGLQRAFAAQALRIDAPFVLQAIDDLGLADPVVPTIETASAPLAAGAAVAATAPSNATAAVPRPSRADGPAPGASIRTRRWLPTAVAATALIAAALAGVAWQTRAQPAADGGVGWLAPPPAPVRPGAAATISAPLVAAVEVAPPVEVARPVGVAPPVEVTRPVEVAPPAEVARPADAARPADVARSADAADAARPAKDAPFSILVASFNTRGRADQLVEALTSAGYRAHAVERDWGPPRGRIVHVSVGGYQSAIEVARDLHRIRAFPGRYFDARIVAAE